MLRFYWTIKLLIDILRFGIVNRAFFLSFSILALLVIGMVILGVQISAPFIYTLF